MGRTWLFVFLTTLLGQPPVAQDDSASQQDARSKRERLREFYTNEAAGYTIFRDACRNESVELRREPVYVWTNPLRERGLAGAVFVWTCRGRAEVLGCFWSLQTTGRPRLYHEFHSLSLSVLAVERPGTHTSIWTPRAPGIKITPIPGAPRPARSPAQRLSQMRVLTRDFSSSTNDRRQRRWELRLLPQPLYRYESTDPDVSDGALFAFVSSDATDPEALLVIEARKVDGAADPIWHYAIARFTDLDLWVRYQGKEVFTAPLIPYNSIADPERRYDAVPDRDISPVEEKNP
jgi:hypothetical protein